MTIMFSDIRSYTTLSETMTPKENFDFLNAYLSRLGPMIRDQNGFVNQYLGDGIMALFPRSPEDAVISSISIQKRIKEYNEYRKSKNRIPIKSGIGLHTGSLMLGVIGEELRMDDSVVSDAVNLASRMEGLTKYYGVSIIASRETLMSIENRNKYNYRFLGKVQVKGKKKIVSVYEVFDGDSEELLSLKKKTKNLFEEGLSLYFDRKFEKAKSKFEKVLTINKSDNASILYLNNCERFIQNEPSEEWSGVETLQIK